MKITFKLYIFFSFLLNMVKGFEFQCNKNCDMVLNIGGCIFAESDDER